jgi:hypothetical protein
VGGEQGLFGAVEKIEALEVSAFDRTGLGEAVKRPDASREVVRRAAAFIVSEFKLDGQNIRLAAANSAFTGWQ